MPHLTRRTLLVLGTSLAGGLAGLRMAGAQAALPPVHVVKDAGCPCCDAWTDHLTAAGFAVTVEEMEPDARAAHRRGLGMPDELASCHTAQIDIYLLEGHVPAADVVRLLAERPDAVGLSAPGMPIGSPGMGPEDQREAYDVVLVGRDGLPRLFSHYPAA